MFGAWFEKEGYDESSLQDGQDGLFAMRTEAKTRKQYRSKVNVLCLIVLSRHKEAYGYLVRGASPDLTFNMTEVRRMGSSREREMWTQLLNEIAGDPSHAKSQVVVLYLLY